MAREQKSPYVTAYSNGYTPPKGNAGSAAIGEYSTKHNPKGVPMKGSMIGPTSEFGNNADRSKIQMEQRMQARREGLRGYAC